MPLNGYSSLCEERQRIIVSRDSGTRREHRAFNNDPCHVTQYKIDGDIVRDTSIWHRHTKRCAVLQNPDSGRRR